jgi:outer membrane protein assembly factor BamB
MRSSHARQIVRALVLSLVAGQAAWLASAAGAAGVAKPVPAKPAAPTAKPAQPGAKPAQPGQVQVQATLNVVVTTTAGDPLDWPNWRGPEQNGISREKDLIDRWDFNDDQAGNVLWKNAELATISTPIVLNGKVYTLARHEPGTQREQEKVICADALTGEKIWENKFNVYLSDVPAERVGWSSCVGDPATGRIYALGVCGLFQCLDGNTGKTVWSRSLSEEFGLLSTYGGRTNVPVLFEDKVLISAVITNWGELAKPAHRFMAFDKNTGETIWINGTKIGPEDTTYSTPFLQALKGQAAMAFGSGDGGVWALQPRTGKPIWWFQLSRRGINVSPVVSDDKVYIAHAEENMDNVTQGAIVQIDGTGAGDITKTGEVWRAAGMDGKSSPLLVDGRLYACDDGGKMFVLDAKTGQEICKPAKLIGTIVRASPVYADGKIYICTTSAWHIFQPTKDGVKLIHKLRMSEEDEISGSPAISHGRIYLPTGGRMYCLGSKDQKPSADPRPAAPAESPVAQDEKPAQVQVTPCDLLLRSGESQKMTVQLFNARGQLLKTAAAKFTLDGPGTIDADGKFVAATGTQAGGTIVTAKVGDLTGQARVRTVAPLPWKFDFSDGQVPATWIGARYRHQIRDVDGNKVMVKVTTIPKGTRSQSWMGPTDLHDYTVQADVLGVPAQEPGSDVIKLADAGLIAQRYTFDLMGAKQQVQIRSWTPQIDTRFSKSVPFAWKPNTWYTLKFQAVTAGSTTLLKGKVWPRDEKEPAEWTVEAVDEVGNMNGSPGLFGNANEAEILYDNIIVKPNGTSDSASAGQ